VYDLSNFALHKIKVYYHKEKYKDNYCAAANCSNISPMSLKIEAS